MSETTRNRSNPLGPRIVISVGGSQEADAALKGFIDEWFVPALVEDYIRRHQRPAAPVDRDVDSDAQQATI